MMRKAQGAAIVALGLGVALAATGCAGNSNGSGAAADGKVTLTLWDNSTTGPGQKFFADAAASYHKAHPDVTIKVQSIQNEDLDGKLQTALNSNSAPDIFLQRGGGKMQAMVDAGQIQALNLSATAKKNVGAAALAGESIDGKVYAVPFDFLPEGIYYSKDLFSKAGITDTPKTITELEGDVAKLKASGVDAIAVGAKDAWPAAHWYYNFALRECSQAVLNKSAKDLKFDDKCWTKAGDDLASFLKTDPFNQGFLTTSSQQGAGSSAGLVANHKAAMELMGGWDPGVMAGGKGDPSALLGGIDGYSVSKNAPKQATQFLEYLVTKDQQEAYAKAFNSIPVNKDAQEVVTDSYNVSALQAFNKAAYASQYLDTLYGQNVGNALNTSVVNLLAGKGSAADIVKDTNAAAAKG
jgi:raffinose/stachyose/melibiose transport system substrate-binding protein